MVTMFVGFIALMALFAFVHAPVSPSTYQGEVMDLENEAGLVMQVTTATLKTDPTSSESDSFCVHPDYRNEVLPSLRDAQRSSAEVTITYERPLIVPPWDCGRSDLIITDVTVHDDGGGA